MLGGEAGEGGQCGGQGAQRGSARDGPPPSSSFPLALPKPHPAMYPSHVSIWSRSFMQRAEHIRTTVQIATSSIYFPLCQVAFWGAIQLERNRGLRGLAVLRSVPAGCLCVERASRNTSAIH